MIAEGVIAMIWAAAGMAFFNGVGGLSEVLATGGGPAGVVYTISTSLLGPVGGVLAMLGVIACPITSGDTAFRSARLTIADAMNFEQGPIKKFSAKTLKSPCKSSVSQCNIYQSTLFRVSVRNLLVLIF